MGRIQLAVLVFISLFVVVAFQNCGQSLDYSQYEQLSSNGTPVDYKPQITTAPMTQNVNLLANVNLEVTATGPNLSFQWYKNDVAIPGATSSTLNIASTQLTDSGVYRVEISNQYGSVSANVDVTVTRGANQNPPTVATAPVSLIGYFFSTGGTFVSNRQAAPYDLASFTVAASSASPVTYQWYKLDAQGNATAIGGATATTYSFSMTQPAQTGTYRVVISNAFGSVMAQANLTYEFVVIPAF